MSSRRRRAAERRRQKNEGSPPPVQGEPDFVLVGILQKPHGLRGEMLMRVMTDFPERLKPETKMYLGDEHEVVTIRSVREHNKGLLVAFEEFKGRNELDHIRNVPLFARASELPQLEEGEYYYHQLIGMQVVSDEGLEVGVLAEILETGANDVMVVRSEKYGEVLLPFMDEVFLGVDVEKKIVQVHLMEGLIDETA
ncbi:MAG: 16S rRNA processing protein RimM [Chloroflexi bacterium]|nr:MAG: 16S rRNA processing protein RimM [Chloroflexota bacterium]MBL1197063.1 16S rRNA processing protein RimM [Chloroflexota bacterium]NOH14357.1 16S rRNA processing protein RimM [Chloroflexota bacterium]